MGIFPVQKEINENQSNILVVSPFSQAPIGHYEPILNFFGTGSTNLSYIAAQAIQCALMIPLYMQEQWRPTNIEWVCSAAQGLTANTTSILYRWIITDETGKVVATTPLVTNTALTVGINSQTVTPATTPLKPGTYYYGFAYYDNTTTVTSTTAMSHFTISTVARMRLMGCKMWTYQGTGAQAPSTMTNGATCTLSIPTTNTVWGFIQNSIRCLV